MFTFVNIIVDYRSHFPFFFVTLRHILFTMSERKEFLKGRKSVTYLDLFAGAGGFSEGFMQAFTKDKYYDFRLASDINENCELTHRVRYNYMLGLDTEFLCQDIMQDSFLPNLLEKVGHQEIDVITGGPSCQSFSLAGRRKKLDKRDDLFQHYLKVIKALRPKYFVMENVKGILTKDEGKIKDRILREIRSIVDNDKKDLLLLYIQRNLNSILPAPLYTALRLRLSMEFEETQNHSYKEAFFENLDNQLKKITRTLPYHVSKSDNFVNTIRHGLLLLKYSEERAEIRKQVIQLKTTAHIDNDNFVNCYNSIIETISDEDILSRMLEAIDEVARMGQTEIDSFILKQALEIYTNSFDECIDYIRGLIKGKKKKIEELDKVLQEICLYRIDSPMVLLSSNYGVPQNRERVVFIGCRNDQELITEIPSTVKEEDKVNVYEALWDLDMIGNGETITEYKSSKTIPQFEKTKKMRQIDGKPSSKGNLFSDWSRAGRLGHRFIFDMPPFYIQHLADLGNKDFYLTMELFNHQTSLQSDQVRERLSIIAKHKDYDLAKKELTEKGLDSQKRNYNVLNPLGQSTTVCTMPDDYIHYRSSRPLTVREMARLQSFDDSFVFQGKRQTGGNNRQKEIPQYTLVGNAVPPLMARAIANTLLQHIK